MKANLKLARPVAVAVGLIALANVLPAYAADAIIEAPPAPPEVAVEIESPGWAGAYVGVQGGYNFGRVRAPGNRVKNEGFVGGGFAGVQGQSGRVVYGVEGDVGYDGSRGNNGVLATRGSVDGSVRARLGYAVTDRVLLYGTAGGAGKQLRVSDAAGRDRETMLGYTVGAGVDAKLTDQVFGRVEYRFSDYGRKTFDTGSGPQRVASQDHKVMVGLGVKF